jgi:magnesium and cobalt exporter, CNNM family
MDYMEILKLLGVLLLVAGNAFFVGSEIALTSARRSKIQQLADIGNRSARIVQILHKEPERFYSVTQVGITIVSLGLGAIGIIAITDVAEPAIDFAVVHLSALVPPESAHVVAHTAAEVFAFIFISFLHIVGGELAPKVYAFHNAEALSLEVSRAINFLYTVFFGVIWFLNQASNGLLRLFGQRDLTSPAGGHFSISGEELRTILMASEREGVLNPEATKMIRGVFELEELTVADVIVPRVDVVGLPVEISVGEALAVARKNKHTRYPVYEGSIDKVVGLLLIKDLLDAIDAVEARNAPIRALMRPVFIIPETQQLDVLLAQFKENRQQMAVVIDEYGGTAGIVTLEDILEEIVGELDDEYSTSEMFVRGQDGKTLVNAMAEIDELTAELEFPFPEGDYNTLAGLMYAHLARVPQVGDSVELPGCRLTVTAMEESRITEVAFVRIQEQQPDGQDDGVEGEQDDLSADHA